MKRNFKLTAELVPMTSWFDNLREAVPRSVWDKLRKEIYAKYNNRCAICKSEGRLNCHEIWEYDDENHVQKLKGFISLCDLCHHVKHLGRANMLAEAGKLDFDEVIDHFLKVNECTESDFEAYVDAVFDKWEERSQYEWFVDLGEYDKLVKSREHIIQKRRSSRVAEDTFEDWMEETLTEADKERARRIRQLEKDGNIIPTGVKDEYEFVCDKCGHKWRHISGYTGNLLEAFSNCTNCVQKREMEKLPSYVDMCVQWARTQNVRELRKIDIKEMLKKEGITLLSTTLNILQSRANIALKSKKW